MQVCHQIWIVRKESIVIWALSIMIMYRKRTSSLWAKNANCKWLTVSLLWEAIITMGLCKTDITPLLMHWSYVFTCIDPSILSINPKFYFPGNTLNLVQRSCSPSGHHPWHSRWVQLSSDVAGEGWDHKCSDRVIHLDIGTYLSRLTNFPMNKMAAISQIICSGAFSGINVLHFD